MDTTDQLDANLPARMPSSSAHIPSQLQGQVMSRELGVPTGGMPAVNSRTLLRGLMRNWWRILILWLVLWAPLAYAIYSLIEPTYEAYSVLQVQPNTTELFSTSINSSGGTATFDRYLETQINTILSDPVLETAVTDPTVVNQPLIKDSLEPKVTVRKLLDVRNIPNTFFIRVALDYKDPGQAAAIVRAVVDSYRTRVSEYQESSNSKLRKRLQTYKDDMEQQIKAKRDELTELARAGNVELSKPELNPNLKRPGEDTEDTMQPALSKVSLEQYRGLTDRLLQIDMELIEKKSLRELKVAESQGTVDKSVPVETDRALKMRIDDEFKHDPEVVSVVQQIEETNEELDHTKGVIRNENDPARRAAKKRLAGLKEKYDTLWENRYDQIRQRLLITTGDTNSPASQPIDILNTQIRALENLKEKLTKLVQDLNFKEKEANTDTFKAAFLTTDIAGLKDMLVKVKNTLEQLKFETEKDLVRIELVNAASTPKVPSNNKRLKYVALALGSVLFAVLGLFLLLEVIAERVADPDMLSTRIQSEVYSLPPLPTARSVRKLKGSTADEQIDRFIQRLDHLRFAVCGDHPEIGLGRCVIITSAIGGEGKTTLAAQLAARCGNAGISTLLIDADLRRASLCPLLDVPEGLGLSDILKDGIAVQDVVIPVQGGTFHLLSAGTPIQDTSRILQGRNFGMLIAQLRQLYDLIIIDSPPILPVPDALILGRWTDGAVLAARYDISRSPQVERARRQLDSAGIPVLGTVINGMRASDSYYGRYTYSRQRPDEPKPDSSITT